MNSSQALPSDAAPRQSSIVAHPWFPKLIGLWFAALFGLCSLALAPELLERIVTTLGIDRIVPAAAPPLGQTARLLLALGMAGVGEIAGLLIGARLAAKPDPRPVRQRGIKPATAEADPAEDAPNLRGRDRHPDAPARKPLSATNDLGDDMGNELGGIDNALRRRALANETEREPRSFIEAAPLPGGEWRSTMELPSEAESPGESTEAFDLAAFDAPSEAKECELPPTPFVASFLAPPEPAVEAAAAPVSVPPPVFEAALLAVAPGPCAGIATASLEDLGVVQLSERLALALQARRERRLQAPVTGLPETGLPVALKAIAPFVVPALPDLPRTQLGAIGEDACAPVAEFPAFVPLVFAAAAPLALSTEDDCDDHDDIPALARSLALPRLTGKPAAASAQVPEPVAPELERGLEILARRAHRPVVESTAPTAEADPSEAWRDGVLDATGDAPGDDIESEDLSHETLEQGYSSLLAMGSSFQRPEAVRIEEPHSDEIEPVVIFPGQGARAVGDVRTPLSASANAPFARPGTATARSETPAAGETATQADPEETDRALRAALASLQRISGAR